MARERRIDRADLRLRPPQKRDDGSVRYDAVFTRAGVFEYSKKNADGTTTVVREYRSPEQVSRADSLATLELAHVTNGHPPKKGMAKNRAVGSTGTDIKFDAATGFVTGSCLIRDDATNKDVDGGIVELSCGYEVDIVEKPGVAPDGQRYDREQVDVIYEHVALVPKGRAGSDVRLRTDGDEPEWRDDAAVMVEGPWSGARVIVASTSLSAIDLESTVRQALGSAPSVTVMSRIDRADADAMVLRGYGGPGSSKFEGAPCVYVSSRELSLDALHTTVTTALAALDVKVLPEPTRKDRADEAGKDIAAMDELQKKLASALADLETQRARADAAEKARDAAVAATAVEKTRADKAEASRDAEKDRADKADKARQDAVDQAPVIGRARVELELKAKGVLGKEFKVDGVADHDLRLTSLDKLGIKVPADKRTNAVYVEMRFDTAMEDAGASVRADAALRGAAVITSVGGEQAVDLAEASRQRNAKLSENRPASSAS